MQNDEIAKQLRVIQNDLNDQAHAMHAEGDDLFAKAKRVGELQSMISDGAPVTAQAPIAVPEAVEAPEPVAAPATAQRMDPEPEATLTARQAFTWANPGPSWAFDFWLSTQPFDVIDGKPVKNAGIFFDANKLGNTSTVTADIPTNGATVYGLLVRTDDNFATMETELFEWKASGVPAVAPVATSGTQSGYDENLPMGGAFYGNPMSAGKSPANGRRRNELSCRFRAHRAIGVTAVTFHNRTAKGYIDGNGGELRYFIYPDDGSADHLPDTKGDPYSEMVGPAFVPNQTSNGEFVEHQLKVNKPLEFGKLYHIVIRNEHSDPGSNRISLNGIFFPHNDASLPGLWETRQAGPYYGKGASGYASRTTGGWFVEEGVSQSVTPFYLVQYENGERRGTMWSQYKLASGGVYLPYDGQRSYAEAQKELAVIDGNYAARQVFTVEDISRTVDRLWLAYGHHQQAKTPNRDNLKATLKRADGTVIGLCEYKWSAKLAKASQGIDQELYDYRLVHNQQWFMSRITDANGAPVAVTLEVGEQYHIDFTASAGAGFMMIATGCYQASKPLAWSWLNKDIWGSTVVDFKADPNNQPHETYALRSTDGGKTFPNYVDSSLRNYCDGDFGVLFVPVGMPDQNE